MSLPSSATRPFFGWHVVAATFLLAVFGWGVGFYGPPVFLYAVVARTGWPVAMVSTAVTLHFLFGAGVVYMLRLMRQAPDVAHAELPANEPTRAAGILPASALSAVPGDDTVKGRL